MKGGEVMTRAAMMCQENCNPMPTLSLRGWKREVEDRQDDLDDLALSDLHVDPSPYIPACNDHNISITNLPGRSLTWKGFHH